MPRGLAQSIGGAVGDEDARRARNTAVVNRHLDAMRADGAVVAYEHRTEPSRRGDGSEVDVWALRLDGDDREWTYTYPAVRALIRGYRLGRAPS